MALKKISIVFGTRPEAIKLIPVVIALRNSEDFLVDLCVTAQHRHMLDQVLDVFGVVPDVDLNVMTPNQTLSSLTSVILQNLDRYYDTSRPDMVLVQGDTTTAFAGALAAFYRRIPLGHIEAGLRTGDKFSPYPEELNRVMTSRIADVHFAPTEVSRRNLLQEGVPDGSIHVVGNTVIDALIMAKRMVDLQRPEVPMLDRRLIYEDQRPLVLITGHRRENFGTGFRNMCAAMVELAARFQDTVFVYPVHLNPNVREPVFAMLGNAENILLIEPLAYLPFVSLMNRATVILTDSGGIQEEAPTLGKPVLVMRDTTERPEAVDAGCVRLVGTDTGTIVRQVSALLTDTGEYRRMATASNPYGDGSSAARILSILRSMDMNGL